MARIVDDRDLEERVPRHVQLVNALLARGMVMAGGAPCIPMEDGSFAFGWDAMHRAMLAADPPCQDRTRKEACCTLKYLAPQRPIATNRYIAFKNGILDVGTGDLIGSAEFAEMGKGIVPVVIPHNWNENAAPNEAVEALLDGVSCGETEVRANLEEIYGLCMSRFADDRASAVWLYGEGQNGKSTFIDSIMWMIGERNAASLMLDDFTTGFNMQLAVGKLAVIADDQPPMSVPKGVIGVVKKIVTGQAVRVEQKGKDPYNTKLFCTIIATSNEPPTFGDTSHGSMRRWHPVPFNANFGEDESGRDVELAEKLRTEQAAEWMIRLGIEGLRRIMENEGMTETEYSRRALKEAQENSNSVLAFCSAHSREEFLFLPNVEVWYWRYCDFAKHDLGCRPFEQHRFSQFVCSRFGFRTANDGRYKAGDPYLGVGEPARIHGRKPGDKYRMFREK